MGTELGGSQISSLMETLPGIAQVLRNPVADAIVHLSRAAARLDDFQVSHAEELLQYAVRRSLLTDDEATRVLQEVTAANQKRLDRNAAHKAAHAKAKAAPARSIKKKAVPVKKASAPRKPARTARPVKKAVKKKTR